METNPNNMKQRGISTLVGIIILVVAVVIVLGGVLVYQYVATQNASPEQNPAGSQKPELKTYRDDKNNLSFQYPATWNANVVVPKEIPFYPYYNPSYTAEKKMGDFALRLNFTTGIDGVGGACPGYNPSVSVVESKELTILGEKVYLIYSGNKSKNTIEYAYLSNNVKGECPNVAFVDLPNIDGLSAGNVKLYKSNEVVSLSSSQVSAENFDEIEHIFSSITVKKTDLYQAPSVDGGTYTNNSLGVSFQYPELWGQPISQPLGTKTEILFSKNGNVRLGQGVHYNPVSKKNMTFNEIKNSFADIFPAANLVSQKNITVDKKGGVEFIYSGSNDTGLLTKSIFVPKDEKDVIFEASFSYKETDGTINAFDAFVSTLKLTK